MNRMESLIKKRKVWIPIFLLLAILIPVLLLNPSDEGHPESIKPVASQGVLDLTDWSIAEDGYVQLKGEWTFYWNQLLTDADFQAAQPPQGQLVEVPNVWTGYRQIDGEGKYPGEGYATYRLSVKTQGASNVLALKIPDMSTSCNILIENTVVATCGEVADNEQEAAAQFRPQTVHFRTPAPEFDIYVQVSNYLYDRGGMWYAMELGTETQMLRLRENEMAMNLILLGVFFFMGVYHLAIYLLRSKERVALYFAIGCLIGALRLFVVDEIFLLNLFPDASVELITSIVYFTYYGGVAVLTLYLRELYPREFSTLATKLVAVVSAAFIATVLVLPLSSYTHMIRYYHFFMIALGLYMIGGVFLAIWRKRDGAGLQFFGISFFVLAIFHDILFNLFYISDLFHDVNTIEFLQRQIVLLGLFVLVFVQALVLARRFSNAFRTVEKMSERLLSLDRLKDEFLVNTSHELKTPLHGIMNLSQSMIEGANGPMNESQKHNLTVMVSVARRLTNLIQDIMDFSKLKNNQIVLNKGSVSLQAIVQANMEIFQHFAKEKPIEFRLELPDELPLVYADENRLVQIFYNLIGNAIKFTERGRITVTAVHVGDYVEVSVEDTGVGIPSDKLELIFQSFEQVGSSVSREYGGTGLGLSITKQLVELNDGEISVKSEPGKGSLFTFTVPVSPVQQSRSGSMPPLQMSDAAVPQKWPISEQSSMSKPKHTILAVDDDAANLQVLLNVFAQEPYRLLLAQDGEEALRILEREPEIDLVMLDVMMPRLSGYEVARRIRETYALSELPILLITVKNEPEDLVSGFSAGANDFLTKPFHTYEIRARVRTLLELKASVEDVIGAELDFLRAQIKPHFLYNALNTIVGICPRDPRKASFLLTELSHYLRGSFDFQSKQKFVSLQGELELVQSYVEIEKARFDERLQVMYDIDESIEVLIPPLTIQPLVENAIRHGVMSKVEGGRVLLRVRQADNRAVIEVEDNGVGMSGEKLASLFAESAGGRDGVGLKNIHQRLTRLYGTGLAITSRLNEGTRVVMRIPKNREDEAHELD